MSREPCIRPVALAIARRGQALLVFEGRDSHDGREFYRPLGGGIEFGEHSEHAVRRELREELGAELRDAHLLGVLEEVFTFRGEPRHELLFVYEVSFDDPAWYDRASVDFDDDGDPLRAVWVKPQQDGRPLYPEGLLGLLPRAARGPRCSSTGFAGSGLPRSYPTSAPGCKTSAQPGGWRR